VHRDLSPRNVRCGRELQAKLIDFGAMAPMGSNKFLVGTPPCCAPESVHLLPLDGRTDLFSLGATLYYLLVGHHAYPAREFASLADRWLGDFPRPSEAAPDVPEALDALGLELLRLEPDARPASAAEVMLRLSAIDGAPLTEQQHVARAYLATPTLVGREDALARIHRKLERTLKRGRGESVVVRGPAGVGRSRFLDACVLDASLLGAVAVRADADDGASGEYGVVRAIARQLMTTLPLTSLDAARPHLELLARIAPEVFAAHLVPGLAAISLTPNRISRAPRSSRAPEIPADSLALRPQLQAALAGWLAALCRNRPLVIAVDDVTRIDEPSAALLSLLAHDALDGMFLLTSAENESLRGTSAEHILFEASSHVWLGNLSHDDAEQLLKSLFGDVPHVPELTHRVNGLAAGNPRDLLALAQHLLDRNVVSYEAGAWTLPERIGDAELPTDIAQALLARLSGLTGGARTLASVCALCADQMFSLEECELLSNRQGASLLLDLDEAVGAQVLRSVDDRYGLARSAWASAIRSLCPPEEQASLHMRLALVFERRGHDFRAGEHWLAAGESSRGLDVLVSHARTSQHQTAKSSEAFYRYAASLPDHWFDIYRSAIAMCETLGRPARDTFTLRSRLAGLVPAFGIQDGGNLDQLLARLTKDSGHADLLALPESLDPALRVQRAIAQAKTRYAETPDHDRVLPPAEALTVLVRSIAAAASRVTRGLEVAYIRSLPRLRPFAPASPAMETIAILLDGVEARYSGRFERACEIYSKLLERTGQPDRGGLEASYADAMRLAVMNAIELMEACRGVGARVEWGVRVADHASFRVNAVETRVVQHLFLGDIASAEQCKRQAERMRLETRQLYDASALSLEIVAHVIAEDLTRVRQALSQLDSFAQRSEPWRAIRDYAVAAFHRTRRDPARALPLIVEAGKRARAGDHQLWAQIAAVHIGVLGDLGRHAEALALAERYASDAQRVGFDYMAEPVWLALSVSQANLGQPAAMETAKASLDRLVQRGVRGLYRGLAHETLARVAMLLGDEHAFEREAELCYEAYGCYRNPALLSKHRRLHQDAERRQPQPRPRAAAAQDERVLTRSGASVAQLLGGCEETSARAKVALALLITEARAAGGYLFVLGVDEAECLAAVGGPPSPDLVARAGEYLLSQSRDAPTTSSETGASKREWRDAVGRRCAPVLLSHEHPDSWVVTGVAVLLFAEDAELVTPSRIASAISRHWALEDVSTLLYPNEA
jgi:hypothetical protein